jgi:S1-C subfamily serine protease/pimeloyl-ACP methyl ester carboxylesterase
MSWRISHSAAAAAAALILALPAPARAPDDDVDSVQQQAIRAAVQRVAPSIVQIETSGGSGMIGHGPVGRQIRKGVGPTTGLIVGADGYVVSSAFNFADKPSAILIAIPGRTDRLPAKIVATDQTRMITLLKVEANGLPVPEAAPKKEIKVGHWALALGRTWSSPDIPPSVSVGIVSAVGRIWGKAIQTDAKVSPVNYGGPLVDLQGRVQGVLVPASPRGQDETAGFEWYDSGIGFAIPLEDINRVLPRLKQGQDLKRGLLGITVQSPDIYGAVPVVAVVAAESAAAKADIRPGDTIVEIDGHPVVRQAQILHLLGDKYEGEVVSVKVKRGKDVLAKNNLKLTGVLTSFGRSFLGVLPMRDDPELGEEVRYVYPKSPADAAGIKPGDRIMKAGLGNQPLQAFSGLGQFSALLNVLPPGTELKLAVQRKESKKTDTVSLKLAVAPDTIPDKLPEPASHKKALEPRKQPAPVGPPGVPGRPRAVPPAPPAPPDAKKEEKKKPETGWRKRMNAARDREYWVFVPDNYDPNISYALVLWLHPVGKGKEKDFEDFKDMWEIDCTDRHMILVAPKADSDTGWVASEADALQQVVHEVMEQYTIDRQRVVAHGMGVGGQMALYLAFHSRDLVRGVATTGAVLSASQPKTVVPNQPLSFFIVAGNKDPLVKAIAESKDRLVADKFSVVYRELGNHGTQYLDEKTQAELVNWIDALDRQ